MSEERCERCGSTCVCCCTCGDDDLFACTPQACLPYQKMTLSITKLWFGGKYGWLTYDEAKAKGLREQGEW
jgi:hypothetical protein